MRKIKSRWVDDNNNTWSSQEYSKDKAEKLSASLINCIGCHDCKDCHDCSYCSYCSECHDCHDCSYCRECSECHDCRDCRKFQSNPQCYTTANNIGSRESQTKFYWNDAMDLVVCGCFCDSLAAFKERVVEVHGDNEFAQQYFREIRTVEYLREGGV